MIYLFALGNYWPHLSFILPKKPYASFVNPAFGERNEKRHHAHSKMEAMERPKTYRPAL
jgi:hypothetical protein